MICKGRLGNEKTQFIRCRGLLVTPDKLAEMRHIHLNNWPYLIRCMRFEFIFVADETAAVPAFDSDV